MLNHGLDAGSQAWDLPDNAPNKVLGPSYFLSRNGVSDAGVWLPLLELE